jgi:hypothetical protein
VDMLRDSGTFKRWGPVGSHQITEGPALGRIDTVLSVR